MPRVKLPDGRIVKFPDGMTPEAMDAALRTLPPRDAPAAPAAEAEPADEKTLAGFLGNAALSTGRLIGNSITGAIDIGRVAHATYQNPLAFLTDEKTNTLARGVGGAILHPGATASAAKEYFGKRYGGLKEIGDTLYEDPAGVAADVATVASLGGGALARAPGTVGRIGRGLAAVGGAVDPMTNVGRAAGAVAPAVSKGLAKAGEVLNESALGVTPVLRERNPGVKFGRLMGEEGLALTDASETALAAKMTADKAELAQVAGTSAKTIDPREVVKPLQALAAERRGGVPGSASYNEAADIDKRVQQILKANEGPVSTEGLPDYYVRRERGLIDERELKPISLPQARRSAIDLNAKLYPKGGAPVTDPLLHAERQGYAQALENAEEGIGEINARFGPRKALFKAMRQARRQSANVTRADLIKGTLGAMGGGLVGGGPVGAGVGALTTAALRSPMVKSLAGRELFRLSRAAPTAAAAFEANGPLLTRLALLAQMAPESEEE